MCNTHQAFSLSLSPEIEPVQAWADDASVPPPITHVQRSIILQLLTLFSYTFDGSAFTNNFVRTLNHTVGTIFLIL